MFHVSFIVEYMILPNIYWLLIILFKTLCIVEFTAHTISWGFTTYNCFNDCERGRGGGGKGFVVKLPPQLTLRNYLVLLIFIFGAVVWPFLVNGGTRY